jgi:hypothetical protein
VEKSPPFSKGGQGGLNKGLIIPLNPPLKKGDLKPPFLTFNLVLRTYLSKTGFELGSWQSPPIKLHLKVEIGETSQALGMRNLALKSPSELGRT